MTQTLEAFLKVEADKLCPPTPEWSWGGFYERYSENVNPDAIGKGHMWLENGTSYIWKVGVLTRIDDNKCDWIYAFIGHEREPGKLEFIGHLHWQDGENDDPARCLPRYVELLRGHHAVFDRA